MCNCISEINKELKTQGLELELGFKIPEIAAFVPIHAVKIDPKNRAIKTKIFIPSYCPFCGEKQEAASPVPNFYDL